MSIYLGAGNTVHQMSKLYVGVSGQARQVQKVYVGVDGKARLAYQNNMPIGSLAVGSIVKIKVNGTARDFIIVQQGNPDTKKYDASCNGAWLLMKDVYTTKYAFSTHDNSYTSYTCNPYVYLKDTFYKLIDAGISSSIKQVKIPYREGTGSEGSLCTGTNGLSTKVFLLSGIEVFGAGSYYGFLNDGSKLDYFDAGTSGNSKRVAYINGKAHSWFLRSAQTGTETYIWIVKSDGSVVTQQMNYTDGIRPAFILPSTVLVDDDGNVMT